MLVGLRVVDVVKLLAHGGSVCVSNETFDASALMQMADSIMEGRTLKIVHAREMDSDDMATIASRGQGRVIFDLT
jgi:hypothetical protein